MSIALHVLSALLLLVALVVAAAFGYALPRDDERAAPGATVLFCLLCVLVYASRLLQALA
ncbi:hypothetical protein [Wenxinia saemankumensis]|uniref:Uncharacterized protein n=1 Tax=Wenxinia saemankumensis TaxID=1447782 RepID=A0A1M6EZ46_9RHOB|nr:hypothetical protein [Wenxinia saemankumensis]SHI90649.1 hypothetical protein SAMN05444417_2256 [Wenxinia saemankumensis]